jgi:hypothetical protein
MPAASSARFNPVSSDVIVLTLMTSAPPWARMMSMTMRFASSASAAQ